MPWNGIGLYLAKFKQLHPPEDTVHIQCAKILSRALGGTIMSENISIQNRCLRIRGIDSVVRGEVYLKKEGLLRLIRAELGEGVVVSIT